MSGFAHPRVLWSKRQVLSHEQQVSSDESMEESSPMTSLVFLANQGDRPPEGFPLSMLGKAGLTLASSTDTFE
jgi:hypothetical protein